MFWLFSQILGSILLGALFGGLIGWALRCRRCRKECDVLIGERDAAVAEARTLRSSGGASEDGSRIRHLEKSLAEERDEVAGLKAKLASASVGAAGVAAATLVGKDADKEEVGDDEGLTFRNRYLESRVRFLEGKLSDSETANASKGAAVAAEGSAPQDMDIARLKWRNRYLEGRVKYLEEEGDNSPGMPVTPVASLVSSPPKKSKSATKDAPKKSKSKTTKSSTAKSGASGRKAVVAATGVAGVMAAISSDPGVSPAGADGKPVTLSKALGGKKDDLREITGVGPKIEGILNDLGIYHFAQVASWSEKEIDWVDARLKFKGRIVREKWIEQCKVLAEGGETEGKRKYKEGKQT